MSIAIRIPVLLILALVIGCATGPSAESYYSPTGKWIEKSESSSGRTETNRLTIIDERGAKYSGQFSSRVEFHAPDDRGTWKGYWIADGHTSCLQEKGGSNSWGESIFHFNETYTRYKGTWDYCGQGRKFAISGVR